jgi:hypothetical protein
MFYIYDKNIFRIAYNFIWVVLVRCTGNTWYVLYYAWTCFNLMLFYKDYLLQNGQNFLCGHQILLACTYADIVLVISSRFFGMCDNSSIQGNHWRTMIFFSLGEQMLW